MKLPASVHQPAAWLGRLDLGVVLASLAHSAAWCQAAVPSVGLVVTTVPAADYSAASRSGKAGFHVLTAGSADSAAVVLPTSGVLDPTPPVSALAFPYQAHSADSQVGFASLPFPVQNPRRVGDYCSASA